jgi:hypothetical protein
MKRAGPCPAKSSVLQQPRIAILIRDDASLASFQPIQGEVDIVYK